MPRKAGKTVKSKRVKSKKDNEVPITVTASDVEQRIKELAKASSKSEQQVLEDMFGDGWLTVMIEESGTAQIDASQLYLKAAKTKDSLSECQRLRNTFAPIASCVKYMRDQILSSGIDAIIDDTKDKYQVEVKDKLTKFIENVHQDRYTRGLYTILAIMIDIAITTGVSAAEVCYSKTDLDFWKYARVNDEEKKNTANIVGKKGVQTVSYSLVETDEPSWKDLGGIVRMKIAHDARQRFKLYRDPKTWQAKYWTVDEPEQKNNNIKTTQGIRISLKSFQKEKPKSTYLHPWQVFWLSLNRNSWSETGESMIMEVLTSALLLERVLKAVGEGIHRAGNKRYFMVCGTEKRSWSGPYIRNMLKQMKEASQKNWSTIPVPSGFDIKDIGGEVFEAQNVVAYFKKIIARGMGIPPSVLGVGDIKDEPDTSYAIIREQVKMAVKYQLFEPHLWCIYGSKVKKKQGGSTEPLYVPNPRFKVEDLLGFEGKMDAILKSFNVANPLFPLTKLKAEHEYCKLMGWDDVRLPTQEEFEKDLEKMEKEAEEKSKKTGEESKDDESDSKKKEQGKPEPQSKERQEKRLEGMSKKGESNRGQSKDLGGTRKPKEIEESAPASQNKGQELTIRVVSESTPTEVTLRTPLDDLMGSLAKKQEEKLDLEKEIENEEGKRKQKKLQKELEKLDTEIEHLNGEIEKSKVETNEIKKTHEAKRKVIEKANKQLEKEEEFTRGE